MTTLIQHSDPGCSYRFPHALRWILIMSTAEARATSPICTTATVSNSCSATSLDNGAPDLPRNSASPARALIGDPRNDENSIVSQFQALILRFHNRVVDENKNSLDFPSLQKIVRWH